MWGGEDIGAENKVVPTVSNESKKQQKAEKRNESN